MKKTRKIGIIGGTFDPIHYGHLLLAENAWQQFALDEVLIIPTGNSPHKDNSTISSDEDRCNMIQIATSDNEHLSLSCMEIEDPEVSYTYRTLQKLSENDPETEYYFIMGGDSIAYLKDWYHPELICKYASIIVAARDEVEAEALQTCIDEVIQLFQAKVYVLNAPAYDVSSSMIRQRIKEGLSVRYLLPKEVESYIRENHLYG